ncbi:MAG: ECF transporter S component [Candidatus Wallbacteria bacterium]|nr:ECF transporter S component [Candidatus Wallbacteria bacterium]
MEAVTHISISRAVRESHFSTRELCVMGAAGAASFLLQTFLKLPTPFADFLKYDPSDVPPILCALAMGSGAGFLTVLMRVLLKLTIFGGDPIGLCMNLVASGSFATVAGALARYPTDLKTQVRAMAAATAVMTVVMIPVNYYVLRFGNYVPEGQIVSTLCLGITPFNVMKGVTNSLIVISLWQHLKASMKL